jgi:hypothetical protein
MNITFANESLNCRSIETYPSRLKIGDILPGPDGVLLKVLTVQPGCPMWESNRKTFVQLLLETEDHEMIPLRGPENKVEAYRPKRKAA